MSDDLMRTSVASIPLALLLLAGCTADRNPAPAAQTSAAESGATPAKQLVAPAPADVGMRYACTPGTLVDLLKAGSARVTLPDGRRIELGKVTASDPPVYSGANLFFTLGAHAAGEGTAHLSQEDGTELACRRQ